VPTILLPICAGSALGCVSGTPLDCADVDAFESVDDAVVVVLVAGDASGIWYAAIYHAPIATTKTTMIPHKTRAPIGDLFFF